LTVRDGIISLGKLNSKQVRHLSTVSLFGVQNNFIKVASQQSLGYGSQFLLADRLPGRICNAAML